MVSRETRLAAYGALLHSWGRTINLTSRSEGSDERISQHIAASLALVQYLPSGCSRLTDLGSGQGFPAIPIAIATGIAIDFIEADRRKAAFLTTVASKLGLDCRVWPVRIERAPIKPAQCITARALASLPALIELAKPLLRTDGYCLFLKGQTAPAEVERARSTTLCNLELISLAPATSYLVRVSGIR